MRDITCARCEKRLPECKCGAPGTIVKGSDVLDLMEGLSHRLSGLDASDLPTGIAIMLMGATMLKCVRGQSFEEVSHVLKRFFPLLEMRPRTEIEA